MAKIVCWVESAHDRAKYLSPTSFQLSNLGCFYLTYTIIAQKVTYNKRKKLYRGKNGGISKHMFRVKIHGNYTKLLS